MKVLIAIKPKFANKILTGTKKYEFRKTAFSKDVDKAIVYASSPISKIIGEFTIDKILSGSPVEIWQETKDYAGISEAYFQNYFKNKTISYAIKIKSYCRYKKPIDLEEIGLQYAPQSFVYLKNSSMKGIHNE